MSPPRIELKKLKVHDDMSEETLCYSAEVWVDGRPAFYARNQGTGGCDHYEPVDAEGRAQLSRCEAYAKTLPSKPPTKNYPDALAMDLELLLGDLIEAERQKKDKAKFLRQLKDRIFLIEDGKLYTLKLKNVAPLGATQTQLEGAERSARQRYPDAVIITSQLDAEIAWSLVKPHLIES